MLLYAEMIDNWLSFLTKEQKINGSLEKLIHYLRSYKCLLILDGLETILESKNHLGKYQENYQSYRQLLDTLGTTLHQSCVIITSREKPENFNLIEPRGKKICCLSIKGEGYHYINLHNQLINQSSQLINEKHYLCRYYDNNYILLQIIIRYMNKFFQGKVDNFIKQEIRLFREINIFLDEHFQRLSPLETIIIKSFNTEESYLDYIFIAKKNNNISQLELWEGLHSLIERSLIIQEGSNFSVAPIIKEYLKQIQGFNFGTKE